MIFRLWIVSSYSYIKRLPPVSSSSPDALNVFKTAKFSSSSIDLCHDIGFVETMIMAFRLWTVYLLSQPPVCDNLGLSASIWYRSVDHATNNAKLCSSSIDLCQSSHHARYWVCRDYDYGFPTLDSVSVKNTLILEKDSVHSTKRVVMVTPQHLLVTS